MLNGRGASIRRGLRALVVAVAALAGGPTAAALAAPVVVRDGTTLHWTGTDGPNGDYAGVYASAGEVEIYSPGRQFVSTAGCTTPSADTVRCSGVTRVVLDARDGFDYIESALSMPALRLEILGGAGGDTIFASDSSTPIIADGQGGQDQILGSLGADTIAGGPDNDFLYGFAGDDSFAGGDGLDAVSYHDRPSDKPVTVTIDGVANDGTVADGETDNVGTDIEDLYGTPGDDRLTGSAGANTLDGGAGADILEGGEGHDSFLGGVGNDTVLSRDGRAERIDCGEGSDFAATDTSDARSGCENTDARPDLEPDPDADGVDRPADCDSTNASIYPGAHDVPNNGVDENCDGADSKGADADGDGFVSPADCDDANRSVSPGTPEVPGNKVDENCDRRKDPLVSFASRFLSSWKKSGGRFRVSTLSILNPAPGATVTILCRGGKKRGCPFATRTFTVPANSRRLRLERPLRKARFKPGAVLEVRMLRRDAIGRVSTFTFKKTRSLPVEKKQCMAPADPRPRKC